jgi:hypothetical protein
LEDIDFVKVNSYHINESGTIVVEKSWDIFVLEDREHSINLHRQYYIVGLDIIQDKEVIRLENIEQLNYFRKLVEEIKNASN